KPFSDMYRAEELRPWDGWGDTFENKPYIHKQQTLSWNNDSLTWDDFAPMVARYFGCVSQVDDAVGRILNRLRQSGRYDDTLIFFTSDHGDMCASHSMLDKHYVLYDDIIRVPLIMKPAGGGHFATDGFVMNTLDIPATIRDVCGLRPLEPAHGMILPKNEKEAAQSPDSVVVTSNGQQFGLYSARAIRTKTHKYVWNLTDTDELYDLTSDPGEKNNLIHAPEMAELVAELRKKLYEELIAQKDRFAGNEWMKRQLLEGKKL
ncbi:MAG: sulfatase-like hydrolase/transferase, partial [Clostridia bacterium]|nr:sulfatase-like hydrolase/transferase [Clostridia bacterium]